MQVVPLVSVLGVPMRHVRRSDDLPREVALEQSMVGGWDTPTVAQSQWIAQDGSPWLPDVEGGPPLGAPQDALLLGGETQCRYFSHDDHFVLVQAEVSVRESGRPVELGLWDRRYTVFRGFWCGSADGICPEHMLCASADSCEPLAEARVEGDY